MLRQPARRGQLEFTVARFIFCVPKTMSRPACKNCGNTNVAVVMSKSEKNPGRKFWSCQTKDEDRCPQKKRFVDWIPPEHPDFNSEPVNNKSRDRSPSRGSEYTQYGRGPIGTSAPPYNDRPQQPQYTPQPQQYQPHIAEAVQKVKTEDGAVMAKLAAFETYVRGEFAWLRQRVDGLTGMAISLQNDVNLLRSAQTGSLNVVPMSDYQ